MEVSALTHHGSMPALRGPTALLRLQSDERLVALTRRGNQAAFEVLCARYQSRLLAFCRHMLASREDAEDVLQEVFAAAYNAVLGDEREINVRPWLYRIARNRSLNHLRRVAPIGVDTMDVHFADSGMTTSDKVMRRENFRELIADVQDLPETQRTALLLREIDALSYEQIAHAMETTVPSVKSLLVRARISLAEASEARKLSCEEVRLELGHVAEGLCKISTPARRHVRSCERCHSFRKHLRENNRALAAIMPVAPLYLAKRLLLAKLGSTASAGGAHVAGGASAMGAGASAMGASASAGAGAAAAGGGVSLAGGMVTAGAGAIATKAVAGLAAAAIVTAGAVAADHAVAPAPRRPTPARAYAFAPTASALPQVAEQRSQPASAALPATAQVALARTPKQRLRAAKNTTVSASAKAGAPASTTATATAPASTVVPAASTTVPGTPASDAVGTKPPEGATEVTSESTQLPSSATAPVTRSASTPGGEATPPASGDPVPSSGQPVASGQPASGEPVTSAGAGSTGGTPAPEEPPTD